MKHGIYETIYGNAAIYEGGQSAWDIDMAKIIPLEMVDFTKRINNED